MWIAIDFDGTIAMHRFPAIGEAVPGAFHWMKKWQDAGGNLILWTMRDDDRPADGRPENESVLSRAVEFCRLNGIEFISHNFNPDQARWSKSPKCYASVYVDDAAFGCPLIMLPGEKPMVDWAIVGPAVLDMIRRERVGSGS